MTAADRTLRLTPASSIAPRPVGAGTAPLIACPEAEREMVGALLACSPADAAPVFERLADDDLTVEACRITVAAMRRLLDSDAPDIGPVAVLGELRRSGELSSTALGLGDGAAGVLLATLYGAAPVPLAAGHRLRIVQEHAARRRVQAAGLRLCQIAETGALAGVAQLVATETAAALTALSRAGVAA